MRFIFPVLFLALSSLAIAQSGLEARLKQSILETNRPLMEVQAFCERRIPILPNFNSSREFEKASAHWRKQVLEKVIFRGEGAVWARQKTKVEWLETIPGGPGYRIRKLRYEAVPGLWIPALLYQPEVLKSKVPVVMNVNGHDSKGKAADYKQLRCINQAKRGMLALNVEWLGMGQLRGDMSEHYRMNQMDLVGTPGIAPFYLSMKRGLDVLLSLPHADPDRVAVAGLSGGGWQTIFISGLDTRVTLANPVAGYSSFFTRARHFSDLGDSEQTPCDLATVVDYTHLTAMLAPRFALLTYNAKDDCCFASPHALPPLLQAAEPVYRLFGKSERLRSHVNHLPGTHNFEQDNREALYSAFEDYFKSGERAEIKSQEELKTAEQLQVDLPANNATFNTLARSLAAKMRQQPEKAQTRPRLASRNPSQNRAKLAERVAARELMVEAALLRSETNGSTRFKSWKLQLGEWTLPVLEIKNEAEVHGLPILVVADQGRARLGAEVEGWIKEGKRIFLLDPFYFGESKISTHAHLFALLVASTGERPLGIQASQVMAVARWIARESGHSPELRAIGPRTSLVALVAGALESKAISSIDLRGSLPSLLTVLEKNWGVNQAPELFCFGLLADFDIPDLVQMIHPRPLRKTESSELLK